jgi:hypothetical protein
VCGLDKIYSPIQVVELDDGHGKGDGHKRDDQVLHIWKRRKRETKIGSRQWYIDRSHFLFALKTP